MVSPIADSYLGQLACRGESAAAAAAAAQTKSLPGGTPLTGVCGPGAARYLGTGAVQLYVYPGYGFKI